MLIAVAVGRVLTKVAFEKSTGRQAAIEDLTSAVLEYTEGFGVIRSYGMTGRGAKDIEASFRGIRDANLAFEASYVPYERALQILYAMGMTAILALSIYHPPHGEAQRRLDVLAGLQWKLKLLQLSVGIQVHLDSFL